MSALRSENSRRYGTVDADPACSAVRLPVSPSRLNDVREAISRIEGPLEEVLDVYCGCRPYDDLLPPGARSTGLDIVGNHAESPT